MIQSECYIVSAIFAQLVIKQLCNSNVTVTCINLLLQTSNNITAVRKANRLLVAKNIVFTHRLDDILGKKSPSKSPLKVNVDVLITA